MCLILVAWQVLPDTPLVVAANRDEFFVRPTSAAAAWPEAPQVFAGRDLEAGGTWLGMTSTGRFAAVTNVREPEKPAGRHSRGHLTGDFLLGSATISDYLAALDMNVFSGFNLLLGDSRELWYCSNRADAPRLLPPGIYGVSNHLLDTPWPKLATSKRRFVEAVSTLPADTGFFELLADEEIVPDGELPTTGVPLEWERRLSAVFVHSPDYGTRASTLLLRNSDGTGIFIERSFGPGGRKTGEVRLTVS